MRSPEAPLGKVLSEKLAVDCHAAIELHAVGMQYLDLYERLLRHPLLKNGGKKAKLRNGFPRQLKRFDLWDHGFLSSQTI